MCGRVAGRGKGRRRRRRTTAAVDFARDAVVGADRPNAQHSVTRARQVRCVPVRCRRSRVTSCPVRRVRAVVAAAAAVVADVAYP